MEKPNKKNKNLHNPKSQIKPKKAPRKLSKIIIHCSATRPSQYLGKKEIESWHRSIGFSAIGYHFVIRRDGVLELGRDVSATGAHCKDYNVGSIGICLVGGVSEEDVRIPENNFTEEQFTELERLLKVLLEDYTSISKIYGHNHFAAKACPSFDVARWLKDKGLSGYVG